MTRQEHNEQLDKQLQKAKRYGDYIEVDATEMLIEDLKKVTDEEYLSYIKVKKMYSENSVISGIMSKRIK